MVLSAPEARKRYEEGLRRVGQDAYQRAGKATTPKEAAEILQEAAKKGEHVTISGMADAYERAYE